MNDNNDIFLNDCWSIYFHDPYDINWDDKSYKIIGQISTVEDYARYFKGYKELFKKLNEELDVVLYLCDNVSNKRITNFIINKIFYLNIL